MVDLLPGRTRTVNDKTRKGFAAIRAYVNEGGGLLVTKAAYSQAGRALFRELLAPLGAEILVEQIVDE